MIVIVLTSPIFTINRYQIFPRKDHSAPGKKDQFTYSLRGRFVYHMGIIHRPRRIVLSKTFLQLTENLKNEKNSNKTETLKIRS